MAVDKDPRTGFYFFRKQVKNPLTGKSVRLYGSIDEHGEPFRKKGQAEAAERKAIDALRNPPKLAVPTFDDWFKGRFWTERVLGAPRGANSPGEQESKTLIYNKWLREPFGALPLDRIDAEVINTFRARLRGMKKADGSRQVAEKTLNNILAVLSTPLQYAAQCGVLARAPLVGVAKVERPQIEWIDFYQVAALVRAAREDERPELLLAVLLDYEQGLRIGEIRELRGEDLNMRARTITVSRQVRTVRVPSAEPNAKATYQDVVGPPKGRKRRSMPMTPAVYEALRGRVLAGFVVSAEPGVRLTKEIVRCGMERIAKRAGLYPAVSGWHVGRHTFATHAALLGINPWDLNQRMGHSSMEETMRYADVARASGEPIPPELVAAGDGIMDQSQRVLCQLSARLSLSSRPKKVAAEWQRTPEGGTEDQ